MNSSYNNINIMTTANNDYHRSLNVISALHNIKLFIIILIMIFKYLRTNININ